MNRALITTLFCSVACTEVPTNDATLQVPDGSSEEAMAMVEGTVSAHSSSSDRDMTAPVKLGSAQGKEAGILSDHSMSLSIPRTEQSGHDDQTIDLDRYFEDSNSFAKHLGHVAHRYELSDDELQRLIRLEEQSSCEVDALIHGKLSLDENNRGSFKFATSVLETGEEIDELEGRVYAGKSTGILMDASGTMVAAIAAHEQGDDFSWTVTTGTGDWSNGVDAKGERFFATTNDQLIGFETLCE